MRTITGHVVITNELLGDSAFDIGRWLGREMSWAARRDAPAITWTFEPFPKLTALWGRIRALSDRITPL